MQLVLNENDRLGKKTDASRPLPPPSFSWIPKHFGEFMLFVMGNEEEILLPSRLLVKHLMEMIRGGKRGLWEVSQREIMFFFLSKDRAQIWAIYIADRGLIPSFVGVRLFQPDFAN